MSNETILYVIYKILSAVGHDNVTDQRVSWLEICLVIKEIES